MRRTFARAVTMGIALLCLGAAPAWAQHLDAIGTPFRSWDVHSGTGVQFLSAKDGSSGTDGGLSSAPSVLGSLSVGRYWTSHLKTELGVTFLTGRDGYANDAVTLAPGRVATTYRSLHARQSQVVLAGIYQFFDNEFAHPYAAAGVRTGLLHLESRRSPYASVYQNGTYQSVLLPEDTTHSTDVRVRPFVALGSKAYFSERVFARPELVLAFNEGGASQLGLNLGFGIDF